MPATVSGDTAQRSVIQAGSRTRIPLRLHHNNFYARDLEKTRDFYEDIAGLPLGAFWIEKLDNAGVNSVSVVGHAFYRLADGSLLAFMHFSDPELQAQMVGPPQPRSVHIALKIEDMEHYNEIRQRLRKAGYKDSDVMEIDHGFVRSMYVHDPNGLYVEFAVDPPHYLQMYEQQAKVAHETMKRYIAGDRTPTAPNKSKG